MLLPALLVAAALQAQDPAPEQAASDEIHFRFMPGFRFGGWAFGSFDSQTALGRRQIDSSLFYDMGIDARVEYGGWTMSVGAEIAGSDDVSVRMGSVLLGKCWRLGETPHFIQLSAGPIFGELEVGVPGYGDFQSGVGGAVRASTTVELHEQFEAMIWLDYRQIRFKFDEPVLSGDQHAGGASFAFGAGFLLRF